MSNAIISTQPNNDRGAAVLRAIDNATLANTTKAQYRKAITNYLATGRNLTDATALAEYARTLPKSSRAFLKAAVTKFAQAAVNEFKGMATPDNVLATQAAVYRLEALQGAITVEQTKGEKAHIWLSVAQVRQLVSTAETLRDKVALGLLVGAGLRREEAVQLTFADVVKQPRKGGFMRTVLSVTGKGAKNRVIPISDSLAADLSALKAELGGGRILRSLHHGKTGESLSAIGLFGIVSKAGAGIAVDGLAPHDLRRTFAQIGYEAGIAIPQISQLLGHESVNTTILYLGIHIDLNSTVSDFVPY